MKYRERNEGPRWLFQWELEALVGREVFYWDEGGVEHRLDHEDGRAPRGERIYAEVAGGQRPSPSLISVSQNAKLVAPFGFAGRGNRDVGDPCFEKVWLPARPKARVIILDHARFHKSPSTQKRVPAAGCEWLFLPTDAPDLNPIEPLWAKLKAALRRILPGAKDPTFHC